MGGLDAWDPQSRDRLGAHPSAPRRVLKVFLSRTAQRVPYVSSQRVLKMLGLILLLVLWFLAAWTIGMLENVDKNIPLVIRTQTARGLHFYICGHDRWDYMMVIGETQPPRCSGGSPQPQDPIP